MIRKIFTLALLVLLQSNLLYSQTTSGINGNQFITESLFSEVLGQEREFYVKLPESIRDNPNQKYPLVLAIDGKVLLPTISDFHNYYNGGYTPEMILVGISNSHNRTRDLTPSKIDERYGMPYTEENGEASKFLEFISQELLPHLEANYPLTSHRTLIGHSYGGLFAIYTFLEKPDLFSNYLAIDPSLAWDDQVLLHRSVEKMPSKDYSGKSVYVTMGGQLHMQNSKITIDNVMEDSTDYTLHSRSIIQFTELMEKQSENGLKYDWKFYPNDLHGTVPFPSIMDGMISLFNWYQMENTDRINSFDTSMDELRQIINHRAEKLESNFGYAVPPYPEELLNMSGYMNMDMENMDKAKMYFEMGLKFYPSSPNVYDSMADYFERNGELEKALSFVQKAYDINQGDYYRDRMEALKKRL